MKHPHLKDMQITSEADHKLGTNCGAIMRTNSPIPPICQKDSQANLESCEYLEEQCKNMRNGSQNSKLHVSLLTWQVPPSLTTLSTSTTSGWKLSRGKLTQGELSGQELSGKHFLLLLLLKYRWLVLFRAAPVLTNKTSLCWPVYLSNCSFCLSKMF